MKRLVLFDIDGTLLTAAKTPRRGANRFTTAISAVFGEEVFYKKGEFIGAMDRRIVWELVQRIGIGKKEFLEKFPEIIDTMYENLTKSKKVAEYFPVIDEGRKLVEMLSTKDDIKLGLMTGNAEKIAWLKLRHAGLDKYFQFGVFGDEVESRIDLAKLVLPKTKKHFGKSFDAEQIVIVGDTIYDIRAGRAVGAFTIIVTREGHTAKKILEKEKPDLLVETLMDRAVREFFEL